MTIFNSTVAIREQNGAYGVYVGLDHWIGSLYLVRYRDPLLATTLSTYNDTGGTLYADRRDGVVTPEVVTMAINGAIASINKVAAAARDNCFSEYGRVAYQEGGRVRGRGGWQEILGAEEMVLSTSVCLFIQKQQVSHKEFIP